MPQEATRKGRPLKSPPPGKRASLGLKVTGEIKQRLDTAARANGRTQSQEAETRLERSFQTEELLPQILDLAFGQETAGLLLLIGECIRDVGPHAAFFGGEGVSGKWTSNPWAFREMKEAITSLLEGLQPPGTSDAETPDLVTRLEPPLNEVMKDLGRGFARSMLGALFGPADSEGDLNRRLRPARERLAAVTKQREGKNGRREHHAPRQE